MWERGSKDLFLLSEERLTGKEGKKGCLFLYAVTGCAIFSSSFGFPGGNVAVYVLKPQHVSTLLLELCSMMSSR